MARIDKTKIPEGLTLYKAQSWSTANDETSERQPHLFYRAEEVDKFIDNLNDRHAFELRRAAALEAFLMKELKREAGRTKSVGGLSAEQPVGSRHLLNKDA